MISTGRPGCTAHPQVSPRPAATGYRAHVAADPETGIITDEKLTQASGEENSDASVAGEFVAAGAAGRDGDGAAGDGSGDEPLAWYGDSAYGSGELREAISQAGHRAVIRPRPVQRPVQGGFTIDDFTVSPNGDAVTCPAWLDLAGRPHRPGHLLNCLPRPPAARPVHHLRRRPVAQAHRARRRPARRPRRLDQRPRAPPGLRPAPAQHRAGHRPDRHLAGPPPQAPLPRRHQEPRLAQAPHRRAQPAEPTGKGLTRRDGAWVLAT